LLRANRLLAVGATNAQRDDVDDGPIALRRGERGAAIACDDVARSA
jgi:hypothetical protein